MLPGVPGAAPAPTATARGLPPVAVADRAGQGRPGRSHSRCQEVRNASFQSQSGLIFSTRWRAWRARRAGMCHIGRSVCWSSPQMLRRYGASARSARARRTYDRVMQDRP